MSSISVLVVDDSVFMRKMISDIIRSDSEMTVIGVAANGKDALELIKSEGMPTVITLDLEMPVMDGITFLKEFHKLYGDNPQKSRILVLSSVSEKGAAITFQALELGALDFVHKPSGSISLDIKTISDEILSKIKNFAFETVKTQVSPSVAVVKEKYQATETPSNHVPPFLSSSPYDLVLIGASTGGPQALRKLIPMFPENFPLPILIVQHMPEGFTASFAEHLDKISYLNVKEAEEGDVIVKGNVYIAPGHRHLTISHKEKYCVKLLDTEKVSGHRPSVDAMFRSYRELNSSSKKSIAIIMTGMGADGAKEITQLSREGSMTIAQDQTTCVVYGMPRVAVSLGAIHHVEKLEDIYKRVESILNRK